MGYKDDNYSYYTLKNFLKGTDSYNTNIFGLYDTPKPVRTELRVGDSVVFADPYLSSPRMIVTHLTEGTAVATWFESPMGFGKTGLTKNTLELPVNCFRITRHVEE